MLVFFSSEVLKEPRTLLEHRCEERVCPSALDRLILGIDYGTLYTKL